MVWMWAKFCWRYPDRGTPAARGRPPCPSSEPFEQRLPRLLVSDEDDEVHPAVVGALEDRLLGGRRLGVTAGLSVDDRSRVEPVRVGQFGADSEAVVHRHVDELTLTRSLALDQGEHRAGLGEAGRRLEALVAARPDRWDRVVVVAAAVERCAEGESDQVGAEPIGPRTRDPERRHRHDDQPRRGCAQLLGLEPRALASGGRIVVMQMSASARRWNSSDRPAGVA